MITPQMQALKDNPQRRDYLVMKRSGLSMINYANQYRTAAVTDNIDAAKFYMARIEEHMGIISFYMERTENHILTMEQKSLPGYVSLCAEIQSLVERASRTVEITLENSIDQAIRSTSSPRRRAFLLQLKKSRRSSA